MQIVPYCAHSGSTGDLLHVQHDTPLNGRQVAERFGRSRNWWYANRAVFQQAHGFPKPLPGNPRRRLWSSAHVEEWFAHNGAAAPGGVKLSGGFGQRVETYGPR
jgi:predicted DNA-binding transcriptional regulator AlpA